MAAMALMEAVGAGGLSMPDRCHGGGRDRGRPLGDAWERVRHEIDSVAGQASEQAQRSGLSRAIALLRHHVHESLNPAYRELFDANGLDPDVVSLTSSTWQRRPVIDKQWLAKASYHRQPACAGRVLLVSTSGSTAAQVLVPVTVDCAYRGLGDNFLRALAMSGVGRAHRHWGIEHRPLIRGQERGEQAGVTGSAISITLVAHHFRAHLPGP